MGSWGYVPNYATVSYAEAHRRAVRKYNHAHRQQINEYRRNRKRAVYAKLYKEICDILLQLNGVN